MIPNPYVILGIAAAWILSLGGSFWFGLSYEKGQEAKAEVLIDKAREAFTKQQQEFTDTLGLKIAQGFQGIRITNTTVQQEIRHEHEIQTRVLDNPDCNVPDSTWRLLQRSRGFDSPRTGGATSGVPADAKPTVPAAGR